MSNHSNGTEPPPGKSIGQGMMVVGWIVILGLLALVFGRWEEQQYNPNQQIESQRVGEQVVVELERNRWGHYVANGTINDKTVTYLLDTGATDVSVPGSLANKLNLKRGQRFTASTANGNISVYRTVIDKLTLGGITMYGVQASINPHMREDEVLLGMSVLQYLELKQSGNTLTLRQ